MLKFQTYRHVGLSNACNTMVLSVQGTNGYQLLMDSTAEQLAKYQPLFDQIVQHHQIPPAQ